jgi:hypothetical protein
MVEDCQFSIKITPDSKREDRYRWAIYKGGRQSVRSDDSFATKREAQTDAAKALQRRRSMWWVSK